MVQGADEDPDRPGGPNDRANMAMYEARDRIKAAVARVMNDEVARLRAELLMWLQPNEIVGWVAILCDEMEDENGLNLRMEIEDQEFAEAVNAWQLEEAHSANDPRE